jgi:hypothetical protein
MLSPHAISSSLVLYQGLVNGYQPLLSKIQTPASLVLKVQGNLSAIIFQAYFSSAA